MKPAHPGQVTFVDAVRGTEQVLPIAEVDEDVAFVTVGTVKTPVVRVVASRKGRQLELKSFSQYGACLKRTRGG